MSRSGVWGESPLPNGERFVRPAWIINKRFQMLQHSRDLDLN
jgi:hypothetical protein